MARAYIFRCRHTCASEWELIMYLSLYGYLAERISSIRCTLRCSNQPCFVVTSIPLESYKMREHNYSVASTPLNILPDAQEAHSATPCRQMVDHRQLPSSYTLLVAPDIWRISQVKSWMAMAITSSYSHDKSGSRSYLLLNYQGTSSLIWAQNIFVLWANSLPIFQQTHAYRALQHYQDFIEFATPAWHRKTHPHVTCR